MYSGAKNNDSSFRQNNNNNTKIRWLVVRFVLLAISIFSLRILDSIIVSLEPLPDWGDDVKTTDGYLIYRRTYR